MQTSLNCVYAPRWPLREAQSGWSAKAWCVKHTRPGVVSELFFFFFFADYKVSSCLSFVKSREFMGGGEGEGSAGRAYWRWTLGSPGHCLFVCSGSEETKGSGGAGFVAKTIGVMVRLAPSHRGAPGSGAKALCKRDFVCCVFFFQTSPHSQPCTHAKWKTLLMRCSFQSTVLIMNSWICIWYQSERMGVLCYR